jgi:hypothetical protein
MTLPNVVWRIIDWVARWVSPSPKTHYLGETALLLAGNSGYEPWPMASPRGSFIYRELQRFTASLLQIIIQSLVVGIVSLSSHAQTTQTRRVIVNEHAWSPLADARMAKQ